jgi:hypothetical protein
LIGLARLAVIGQTDDADAELIVIRLNAGGIDRAISPTCRNGLLAPRNRSGRRRIGRHVCGNRARGSAGSRWPWARSEISESAKLNHHRHRFTRAGGYGEARPNVDSDLRIARVVHMADKSFGDDGNSVRYAAGHGRHFPPHCRHITRNPAINLALKILLNLRPPLDPILRRRHPRAIIKLQHIRHRILVTISRRFIEGGLIIRIRPRPNRAHAELVHHVLMIIKFDRLGCGCSRLSEAAGCGDENKCARHTKNEAIWIPCA